jgi:translation initiation factor IF-3
MVQVFKRDNQNFSKTQKSNRTDNARINNQINSKEVRLIGRNDEQLGIVSLEHALELVENIIENENIEMDLVEVSANANPPVCKIMNYSKYCYEKNKKEKLNKKQSKSSKVKEVVIKPAIDKHDFEHKCRNAKKFLEEGDKVKIMLKMRGREIQHSQDNVEILKRFIAALEEISKIEQPIKQDKFVVSTILSPLAGNKK